MVKTTKKAVTFSIEELLPSQSSASYSSNTPVGYDFLGDFGIACSQSRVSDSSNTPVNYGLIDKAVGKISGMIKAVGVDKLCGACNMMKMVGMSSNPIIAKLSNCCDFMKKAGLLDSPRSAELMEYLMKDEVSPDVIPYTNVGYGSIYEGGYSADFIV